MKDRLNYLRRILKVYFSKKPSYLAFWHEAPAVSVGIRNNELGIYYQTFEDKANYPGPKDKDGVILFDYYFDIGRQYNPLAVAQYGLGNWNLYSRIKDKRYFDVAKIQADWLTENLEPNNFGLMVWKHKFRWHYKKYLESGWYSAHSQGAGISLLLRIYQETKEEKYWETVKKAFIPLNTEIKNGGVKYTDEKGNVWLEEYLIDPPTHILNGFLWALWGVYDYHLIAKDESSLNLWQSCVRTLTINLPRYDAGFWSLYDLSRQAMKMIASPFYHRLHIVQLKVMRILTDESIFDLYVKKFEGYEKNWFKRNFALIYKIVFKLTFF